MSYRIATSFAVLVLAGCGSASAAAVAPTEATPDPVIGPPVRLAAATPFFIPGETMTFDVSYSGIVAGTAVMAVGQPGTVDGRPVLIARSQLESAGVARLLKAVHNDTQTWLDTDTGVPVDHRAKIAYGDKHMRVATSFPPGWVVVEYERDQHQRKHLRRLPLPPDEIAHDGHTALGALRAWAPAVGDKVYFYSVSGRRLWYTELRFAGSETVRTAMGLYPARRFEGVARRLTRRHEFDAKKAPRPLTLWISDDANRLPLRVTASTEIGTVKAELVHYQRPEPHISWR